MLCSLKSILVTWCLFFVAHLYFVHFSVCMLQLMIFKVVKEKKKSMVIPPWTRPISSDLRNWAESGLLVFWGFLGGANCQEPTCRRHKRRGFDPWIGKIPWRHNNPLQYSCLENPHGRRSLAGYSPWGRYESDRHDWIDLAHKGEKNEIVQLAIHG